MQPFPTTNRQAQKQRVPLSPDVRVVLLAPGGTGYSSAVSTKLPPQATNASSCSCASASVFWLPQVMVPRQTTLTFNGPSLRIFMAA